MTIKRPRTSIEFCEQELVIPDGPYKGAFFSLEVQPWVRLWLGEIDSGWWRQLHLIGPTQSGKTLFGFVVPMLWHCFEFGETVALGLPDVDTMATDKWEADILPVIEAGRYKAFLPTVGKGSRGGIPDKFTNGARCKWMGAGGGDSQRAAFTSRVLIVTETEDIAKQKSGTGEADKLSQMKGRVRAYGAGSGQRSVIYLESTLELESDYMWQQHQLHTGSEIVRPCPHCREWVTPGREDLVGWQDAETELDAREKAAWSCPECGELWTEEERRQVNQESKLIHRGQAIDKAGNITGDPPRTETLTFRYSAVDNHFRSAGDIGAEEWSAAREEDRDNAERTVRQQVYAMPGITQIEQAVSIGAAEICKRTAKYKRGEFPESYDCLTAGIDVRKKEIHWVVAAFRKVGGSGQVVDYGTHSVSQAFAIELAILEALRGVRDQIIEPGFSHLFCDQAIVDAAWETDTIYEFCSETGGGWLPSHSYGLSANRPYTHPAKRGPETIDLGEQYYVSRKQSANGFVKLMHANADYWKTKVHERLKMAGDHPGALMLFAGSVADHNEYARHLTAEKAEFEFIQGEGTVARWRQIAKHNHWFDATYLALVAAHRAGVRLPGQARKRNKGGQWLRDRKRRNS